MLNLIHKIINIYLHFFSFIDVLNYKIIVRADIKHLIKNKKILDVGCGDGNWAYLFSKYAKEIHAFDINKILIENARKNINIKYFVSSIEDFKCSYKYDFIICMSVLEHIKDDISALRKMKKCLKKNGYLMISTPNKKWFEKHSFTLVRIFRKAIPKQLKRFFGDCIKSENYLKSHGHIRVGYNAEDFEIISKDLNMKLIDLFYVGSFGFLYELCFTLPNFIILLISPLITSILVKTTKFDNRNGMYIYGLFKNSN